MVFSSLPLYLDPPNWQQQHPNPQHHEFQSPQVLPPPPAQQGGGGILMGGSTTTAPLSSVRPGSSMADRARQAKIPVPEGPLKCPRCESTNTKFCYFNNYSLSQPRHFCKTCRRYWTRGGSLRSVPVGGGCRRNKRKKTGRAAPKSPSKAAELPRPTPPSATTVGPSADFSGGNHLLQAVGPAPPPPFSSMASLQNLTQLGMGNLGLNFSALGMGGANNSGSNLGGYGEDEVHQQGHAQQLPNLLAGFGSVAATSSMYPFIQNMEGMETASYGKGLGVQNHQLQQAGVKMESVGVGQHQQQFWSNGGTVSTTGGSGGLWSDLSGICSSSSPSTHTILR